jgi:hypothetical protein
MDLSTEEKVALHTKKFVLWKTCFSPHQSAYGADYVITKAISSAFFKDSSVVGQNCQRAHFPCPPA